MLDQYVWMFNLRKLHISCFLWCIADWLKRLWWFCFVYVSVSLSHLSYSMRLIYMSTCIFLVFAGIYSKHTYMHSLPVNTCQWTVANKTAQLMYKHRYATYSLRDNWSKKGIIVHSVPYHGNLNSSHTWAIYMYENDRKLIRASFVGCWGSSRFLNYEKSLLQGLPLLF